MTLPSGPAAPSRRSLVLIADDKAAIRALVGRIVTEFDFVPVAATDLATALDIIQAHNAELACAIVGRLAPSMNATTSAGAIQAAVPDLPLIMMGSTPPAPASSSQPALRLFGFLLKPSIIKDLRRLLRSLAQHDP